MNMSMYNNFNNNQQHATNPNYISSSHNTSNGIQATRYHQVENDFLSRNLSSVNHTDMSVQLTRPTSKTALLVRQRRAMLEQISCFLCKGYLIDATTIDECMDSFCKSCIVIYLRSHNNCPKCGTLIQKPDPLGAIRSDKVLQDIVYKLIPGLYDNEMRRRRDFYKGLYGASSSDDDEDCSSGSFNGRYPNLSSEQYGAVSHPKPFYKPADNIDLSIEPQTKSEASTIYYDNKRQSIVTCFTGNIQQRQQQHVINGSIFSSVDSQQFKTYLRCPAKLTVLQLKKFITAKFNISRDDTIHLLYLNESLKDEYSLIDVAYIYDWRGIEHMQLFYIIERDLSKMSNLVEYQVDGKSSKTRQSVGISTQTVKRVCIDPQPKFYEEKNNNTTTLSTNGRSMRPRPTDVAASSSKSTSTQVTQTPILRSYGVASASTQSNGISSNHHHHQLCAPQQSTSVKASVNSAIRELNRLKKEDERKETRSLRSNQLSTVASSSAGSIPKININLGSLNRAGSQDGNKNLQTYGKTNTDKDIAHHKTNLPVTNVMHHSSATHFVPFKAYPSSSASFAGATTAQSSLVTLASFTEARSNHVMATMSSSTATTAATISNSYRNILGAGCSYTTPDIGSGGGTSNSSNKNINANNQVAKVSTQQQQQQQQSQPQLAFSIVTERGITIVRRLNNQGEASSPQQGSGSAPAASVVSSRPNNHPVAQTSSATNINKSGPPVRTAPIPSSHQSPMNSGHATIYSSASGSAQSSGHHGYEPMAVGANTSTTSSSSGTTARHHVKVKPVYKTLVDPTKLKSPNFKKLGYTARH